MGAFCDLVSAGVLAGWGPPVAGAMELTVIQQSLTVYLSVRPRRSKVCSHGFAVLRYPGSAHSKLFDDDMPIRHHALPDHEFVFGPLPTPCFCHVSLRGGPCTDAKTLESGLNRRQLTTLWMHGKPRGGLPSAASPHVAA